MAKEIYIRSVTFTPNPVEVNKQYKIEVEIYTLFPAADLYPALNLYPGADLFTLYPNGNLHPGPDVYPTKGGIL